MVTAEELVVSIKSDGTQETEDDLEGVERSMQNTADSAGDSAEELEGFSQRFQGAMGAAVAALAVGAAGLMSQVPVVGEAFSGLGAIVEALSFQMDSVLRPVLSPLTDFFFNIANAIFEADGATGSLIGGITSLVAIAATLIPPIAAVGAQLGVWASTGAGVLSILGTLVGAITTVAGAVASLPIALGLAVAAIAAFAIAYLTNFRGVRDSTNSIIGRIVDTVVGGVTGMVDRALDALSVFDGGVSSTLLGVASRIANWASDLASDAYNWGRNLIERFIDGIQSAIGRLRDFLGDLRDIGDSIGIGVPDLGGFGGGGGGGGGGESGRPRFGASGGASTGGQQIDGRQISESTGRYRSDPANRRGI